MCPLLTDPSNKTPRGRATHANCGTYAHAILAPIESSGASGCLYVSFILVRFPYAPTMGHVKPEANSTVAKEKKVTVSSRIESPARVGRTVLRASCRGRNSESTRYNRDTNLVCQARKIQSSRVPCRTRECENRGWSSGGSRETRHEIKYLLLTRQLL